MKRLLLASLTATMLAGPVAAEDIKLGVVLGFTGPIESLTPDMAAGAELAMKEVSDAGGILDGSKVVKGLLPGHLGSGYARWERYGPLLLVGLIVSDYFFDTRILWSVLGPIVSGLTTAATGF